MHLTRILCGCSLFVLLALPAGAEPLAPRGEVSVKGGTDRSLLTTEFWAPLAQQSDRVLYGDIRLMGDNDENREGNLGVGYRQIKNDAVVGVHGWIDRRRTQHNSTFHQLTFGVERLGHTIDARANVYIPINNGRTITTRNIGMTSPYLAGSGIYYDTNGSISETPQYGVDGELGYRIPFLQKQIDAIRVYGGGYYFFRDNTVEVPGARFRTEAQVNKIVNIGARVQYDKPRGTQGFLEATLKFPFSAKRLYQESGIHSRLDESPERDVDIVTESKVTDTGLKKPILNTTSGAQQRILYVDNMKADGGDGSYEKPFNSLKAAEVALQANDILYVNRGDGTTRNMDQGIVIDRANVQLIGSGSALTYGGITLLNAGSAPLITNTMAPPADQSINEIGNGVSVFSDNVMISGLSITAAQKHGIYVTNQGANALNQITISNVSINTVTTANTNFSLYVFVKNGATIENASISDIRASGGHGIGFDLWAGSKITNILAENITATNGTRNLRVLNNGGTVDIVKLNNIVANNGSDGVYVNARNSGVINKVELTNISASNNTSAGITPNVGSSGRINYVTINNANLTSNFYGLLLSADNGMISNGQFSDITANNSSGVGIYFVAHLGGTISNSILSQSAANSSASHGVYITANNGGYINNTTINQLTANTNAQHGVFLNTHGTGGINGIAISNVTANNNQQNGLYINGSTTTTSVMDNVNVANSNFLNNAVNGIFVQKGNASATFNVDLGGGAFGSVGQNRSSGNTSKDLRLNYTGGGAVFAKNNWWGNAAGLQAGRVTLSASTTVDSTSFLTTDPRP